MPDDSEGGPESGRGRAAWPGWGTSALALAAYAGGGGGRDLAGLRPFDTALPGPPGDPLQHLWIIRWSRACLLEGRSPFFCPDIQFPVGRRWACSRR